MIRDNGRRQHGSSWTRASAPRPRRTSAAPAVEVLEGRQLLSFYTGPTSSRPVFYHGTFFTVTVLGGGYERIRHLKGGDVGIDLFSTNPNSTLSITAQARQAHFSNTPLQIGQLNVKTGQLGAINASAANLDGAVTALQGSLSTVAFNSIGPAATLNVRGSVANFNVPSVNLGSGGRILIGGSLTGSLSGAFTLDGGQFIVGGNVTGALTPGSLTVDRGGILALKGDVTGGIQVGSLDVNTNGLVAIGNNIGGPLNVGQNLTIDTGGRFLVVGNVTGPATVGGNLSVTNNGLLSVGRDLVVGLTVSGNLDLGTGGSIAVGRDVKALNVDGNIQIAAGGGPIVVQGNLNTLQVGGVFQGKGSPTSEDLAVGLDLSAFSVLGGTTNQGGLQGANIDVGKSLLGLNIPHGIFNSLITAGVNIDGKGPSGGAGSVGPDGPDAILDSQLIAGVSIKDLTIDGNVRSNFASNPKATGYPTRIIAGEDRQGVFSAGGLIDNFQIVGALIDSVLAASVQPNGGNGTIPVSTYSAPPPQPSNTPGDLGNNTYDAPAGVIVGGPVTAPVSYPNYSEASYYNETFTRIAYNTAIDPTIDDFIFPGGAINPSFASAPLTQGQLANPNVSTFTQTGSGTQANTFTQTTQTMTLQLPLPTKSTVLGGVISTQHGDSADYAGLFAANTSGVFVGALPGNS